MENILKTLQSIEIAEELEKLSDSEINAVSKFGEKLIAAAKSELTYRSELKAASSDKEYIEITIDGKLDRIKSDIEILNISCNSFKKLPAAIYTLKNLKKLYLFNNEFSVEEKRKIRRSFPPTVQIHF